MGRPLGSPFRQKRDPTAVHLPHPRFRQKRNPPSSGFWRIRLHPPPNPMTPERIEIVQSTWQQVKPIADQAAELFYGRLFELDPSLKSLFKGDMKEQGKKLMQTLNVAVTSLTKLDTIIPAIETLGRRHVGYGVPDESYATVGEALLWTLEKGLGDAFTDDAREAWTETYVTLSNVMLDASKEARSETATAT